MQACRRQIEKPGPRSKASVKNQGGVLNRVLNRVPEKRPGNP